MVKASAEGKAPFFGKYDYGAEENAKRYNGSVTPPAFELGHINAPLYIFYGNGDKLIAEEDVKSLAKSLPSTEAIYQIDYEGWNHNDFVYAIHAKKLVYDIIIKHMQSVIDDYASNRTLAESMSDHLY